MMEPERKAKISERAYKLWASAGFPEGQDLSHWLQAEQDIDEADANGEDTTDEPHNGVLPVPTPDYVKKD